MKMSEVINVVCVIILVVALIVTANQRDTLKKQAVEKGYAEWVVTPEGNATWQWKEKQQ